MFMILLENHLTTEDWLWGVDFINRVVKCQIVEEMKESWYATL